MLDFKFDKDANYLIACTYGPDSMALLDMMISSGVSPVVCFVNYHTNDSIGQELESMKDYCESHQLRLEVLDTATVSQEGRDTSFAVWARKTRYDFFEKIYEKYDAAALFIAHSQDDLIETYLTQKKLGRSIDRYGLTKISTFHGMIVARPLLDFTKEDLRGYNAEHHVPYSEHMDRFENSNTRGQERNIINQLNEIEREQIINEMRSSNDEKISFMNGIANDIASSETLNIREIIALDQDEFASALLHFVAKAPIAIHLSPAKIKEIRQMCLSPEPNCSMKLKGNVYLLKEYDIITMDENPDELPYTYALEKPSKLSTPEFDLDFSMGAEDRFIHESDYPLTIRTAIPGDTYILNGYLFPVRRMFIDANMPQRLRHVWPVFLNKDGKIVYVPRYRKSFQEYHSSTLHIHVKDDER